MVGLAPQELAKGAEPFYSTLCQLRAPYRHVHAGKNQEVPLQNVYRQVRALTTVQNRLLTRGCSDHSIYTRGANRELYEWMTDFLYEKWGKGGVRRGW